MEIKATLNKPYAEKERFNFIVKYNHELGYDIVDAENCLQAWGKTPEEIQEDEKNNKKSEIQKQIDDLDKKRIRAVCEPSMKTETESWLDYYNNEIKQLRIKLSAL